jgi:Small Multidrug Resistance protein
LPLPSTPHDEVEADQLAFPHLARPDHRAAIGATALCRRRRESVTRALPYLYLALAIAFEVLGTSALKASETLTRLVPSLVTLIAYTASFVFLALSLRTIPIGIAYAIWAGLGIVLIAL